MLRGWCQATGLQSRYQERCPRGSDLSVMKGWVTVRQARPEGTWIRMENGCPVSSLLGQCREMRLGRYIGARWWGLRAELRNLDSSWTWFVYKPSSAGSSNLSLQRQHQGFWESGSPTWYLTVTYWLYLRQMTNSMSFSFFNHKTSINSPFTRTVMISGDQATSPRVWHWSGIRQALRHPVPLSLLRRGCHGDTESTC